MESPNNPIKFLEVKAARTKDSNSAEDLQINVTVEVPAGTCEFVKFSPKDLYNLNLQDTTGKEKLGILKLNVHIIFKKGEVMTQHLEKLTKSFEFSKSKEDTFEFDNVENSLLLVEVFIDGIRPEGTKRRVITYEDSDEIDETVG